MFYVILSLSVVWIACLMLVIHGIQYPNICNTYEIANNSKFCFEPMFQNNFIDIHMYVFKKPNNRDPTEADCESMSNSPVYQMKNHSISMKISRTVYLPYSELNTDENLWGCLYFSESKVDEQEVSTNVCTNPYYHHIRLLRFIQLTSIISKSSHQLLKQKKARKLIQDTQTVSRNHSTSNSSNFEYNPLDNSIDNSTHFSRFAIYPLLVRFIGFDRLYLKSNDKQNYYYHSIEYPYLVQRLQINKPTNSYRFNNKACLNSKLWFYEPVIMIDDITIRSSQFQPIIRPITQFNYSDASVAIKFEFESTSKLYYAYKKVIQSTLTVLESILSNDNELDEIKYWLSDQNLVRYVWSQLIMLIHIALEYLAFRDDWIYFVGRKSNEGYSVSSLFLSLFNMCIVFLYLHDQKSSYIILFSVGKDMVYLTYKLVRIYTFTWKIEISSIFSKNTELKHDDERYSKARKVKFSVFELMSISIIFPEGLKQSIESSKSTLLYDYIAIMHLGLILYPLMIGISFFSLLNHHYTSFYSWIISSLMNFVSLFGFLSMTPQLYINYKLKSVAHLPIKSFVYKIFSTFIDDIFAFFIIQSPLKYKLMTFRDDIIFFIFLLQWMYYPKDVSRVNEYGYKYESTTSSNPNISVNAPNGDDNVNTGDDNCDNCDVSDNIRIDDKSREG